MGLIPPLTRAQKREAIYAALDEMSAMGITSMTEPALGPGGDSYQGGLLGSECIGCYQDLLEEARLKVRVNILYLLGGYGSCSLADLKAGIPASASIPASATRSSRSAASRSSPTGYRPTGRPG